MQLIQQPDNAALAEYVSEPSPDKKLLVVYDAELPFLERVLAAAGYDDPPRQLHLVRAEKTDEFGIDLSVLAGRLEVDQIMLFGQDLSALGIHFSVVANLPVEIAGRTYLIGESLSHIAGEKEAGNNTPAAALWRGVKGAFLRKTDVPN
ncbi:hypothetical protein [Neolewinella antarctica]|uniref:Uncharacterized protein n=1 Tax=Neolewinella antarctica TaxID=442734 RepID=A0ABX0XC04_9BACT|nr:hypothetical protein [Neolewinella antarctica]NJC26752.1 hypothetical protein [Neolewinella antarctica]